MQGGPSQPSSESPIARGTDPALEYARGVHAEHLQTNKDLYLRAQIVLTLDGIVVAALGAAVASKTTDLQKAVHVFGWETWSLLGIASLALVAALLCAAMALFSRHRQSRPDFGPRADDLWFYRRIADIEATDFVARAGTAAEAQQRLMQVRTMAPIMVERADWLNRAFIATATALAFFALAAGDYLIRLR